MTDRASIAELFDSAELLTMMQFDFNTPVDGLINLTVAPPYGLNGAQPATWNTNITKSTGPLTSKMVEEFMKKFLGGSSGETTG